MQKTPMMEQYMSFKNQYKDKIVLFRMGDFFETFGDDAKTISKVLNITLTTRDRKTDPTPLAGFPHHALNQYLPKIINAGLCAVIVDQIEDPKLAKGIVKRAVTRVVTPSTIDESNTLNARKQFLGTFVKNKKNIYCAFLDISTGEFKYTKILNSTVTLNNLISSWDPVEVAILEGEKELVFPQLPVAIIEKAYGNLKYSQEKVKEFFNISNTASLGIDNEDPSIIPIAMAISYIVDTQKTTPSHVRKPAPFNSLGTMILDRATINNLELVRSAYNQTNDGSLFSVIDATQTLMGKRLLYSWILSPLLDEKEIKKRLTNVEYFFQNRSILENIRTLLSGINDIERLVGKIGLGRANARDLKALEHSLTTSLEILDTIDINLEGISFKTNDDVRKKITDVIQTIAESIEDNPPLVITEGHIIKYGYNKEIDEIRDFTGNSKNWIKDFEERERVRTGINSLKIGFTKVFGYYIEISNTHKLKVPQDYIRKQTLVNAERYITQELKEKEDLILNSQEKLSVLEYNEFQKIRNTLLEYIGSVSDIGLDIAKIDVFSSLAHIAVFRNYIKPDIYGFKEKNGILNIINGRHPIVESLTEQEFVSNDTLLDLNENRMGILTGPNMSGKSTYIRQVATIVLLAQIGSYVPAKKCEISLVDRIFTRVGASDDLSRGRSTFMVEMEEAANIINNATRYSLVILDEIGRGTSTYDGVSIAWALAEYLVTDIKARVLFATHYHELLKLPKKIGSGVKNYNVLVEEDTENGKVLFLRKIVEGGTDRSYGIYVAQMAGLPKKLVARANEILEGFEQESLFSLDNKLRDTDIPNVKKSETIESVQIPLFNVSDDGISKELLNIEIDNLTPIEALNLISEWKKKLNR